MHLAFWKYFSYVTIDKNVLEIIERYSLMLFPQLNVGKKTLLHKALWNPQLSTIQTVHSHYKSHVIKNPLLLFLDEEF